MSLNRLPRFSFLAWTLLLAAAAFAAEVPRPAGPLEITTMDGRKVSLSDLKGKPVLVMYFSTDCPHCQAAATKMAPIYKELSAKGFEFVGVTLNPTAEGNLGAFVDKYAVKFPVGLGDRSHFSRFTGLSVMTRFYYPYLAIVDKNGKIVEEHEGSERAYMDNLSSTLRESLAKVAGGS